SASKSSTLKRVLFCCRFAGFPCRYARHQADNLAKLRFEFLSVFELIAQILCAVEKIKSSNALDNTQILRVVIALATILF
ncbi:MAG TPA: hypothetical protein DCS37_01260, partial [Clostridiales bacterium]|nr:hypothetical protein [Clostridiales bacterium]